MPKIDLNYIRVKANEEKYGKGYSFATLSKKDFQSISASVLGLGDISEDGKYIQALAVFFDLEGFTSFCNQVDSHLVIPEFLKRYLEWLFQSIKEKFKEGEIEERVTIWGPLPFYAKFLGDGILFLWDTEFTKGPYEIQNIVRSLHEVSTEYVARFLPDIGKHVSKPPSKLRCGTARGQIISIGNGNDYVGSCINIAARLQKLSRLTFAVSRRGFDLSSVSNDRFWKQFILKKVELRGIGSGELVYILRNEYEDLTRKERNLFTDM